MFKPLCRRCMHWHWDTERCVDESSDEVIQDDIDLIMEYEAPSDEELGDSVTQGEVAK